MVLEERLKKEFFNSKEVISTRESVEQRVLSAELSPFSGAQTLIEAFTRCL